MLVRTNADESWATELVEIQLKDTVFVVPKRYALDKIVGYGTYGVVAAGRDVVTNEKVAIKKITRPWANRVVASRTLREIRILRQLDHENVIFMIELLDVANLEHFEEIYVVMEYMKSDLHAVIHSKQALTDQHTKYFLWQMLKALKYLHSANIVHRDLKPGNLLVDTNCDLKLCDFGLARTFEPEPTDKMPNAFSEYVVTRWYRAPELLVGNRQYDAGVDVWAAGCILAEMFLRRHLFSGDDYVSQLRQIVKTVGTPSSDDIAFIHNKQALKFIKGLPASDGRNWARALMPDANPLGQDLLERMLEFNPAKRITVQQALEHPYLDAYHAPLFEPAANHTVRLPWDTMEPTIPKLKELMFKEVKLFHPEAQPPTPREPHQPDLPKAVEKPKLNKPVHKISRRMSVDAASEKMRGPRNKPHARAPSAGSRHKR